MSVRNVLTALVVFGSACGFWALAQQIREDLAAPPKQVGYVLSANEAERTVEMLTAANGNEWSCARTTFAVGGKSAEDMNYFRNPGNFVGFNFLTPPDSRETRMRAGVIDPRGAMLRPAHDLVSKCPLIPREVKAMHLIPREVEAMRQDGSQTELVNTAN